MLPVARLGKSIRVTLFDAYGNWTDGFVLWWSLEDEHGEHAVVGLDDRKASPTRCRLFEGARHPAKGSCVWIELGSVDEGMIVPVLSQYLDSPDVWKQARRFRAFEEFLEYTQRALVQHGSAC